jgi:HAE1 family hydrophobic/amphiphilic exporter-1
MAIFQSPGANALDVGNAVRQKMGQLAREFPPGLVHAIPFDTTKFISASIHEVYKTLFEAAILVLVVILVFLQDWRATLVPATTVPVTIIGAFAAMAALGFTVNLSTLFAIVLAIGIVVDDAIVVVEGAAHNIEKGMSGHDAAIGAMDRLFGPIIGITLVLMAVFLPAAFLPGLTGKMYAQFALVIAATALLSAINAATLKPTQCAMWLRRPVPPEQRNFFYRGFNLVYDRTERWYAALIARLVGRSGLSAVVALAIIVAAGYGLARIPTGFLPIEDQGYLLASVQLPDGASLQRTQRVLDQVTEIARKTPGVDQVVTIAGVSPLDNNATLANAGVAYLILKDWGERGKEQNLISLFTGLNRSLGQIDEANILVLPPPPIQGIGNAGGFNMQIELRDGSFDLAKLQGSVNAIVANAATQSSIQRVIASFRSGVPQYHVEIDRAKTQTVNVTVDQVFSALAAYLGSSYVDQFNKFGRVFQIYRQQPLCSDRAGAADRAVRQERDPDRRVRARAARRRQEHPVVRRGGRARPLPADPDDVVRVHFRRVPAGGGERRRGQRACLDRDHGLHRDDRLDLPGRPVRAFVLRGDPAVRGMAPGTQAPARRERAGGIAMFRPKACLGPDRREPCATRRRLTPDAAYSALVYAVGDTAPPVTIWTQRFVW